MRDFLAIATPHHQYQSWCVSNSLCLWRKPNEHAELKPSADSVPDGSERVAINDSFLLFGLLSTLTGNIHSTNKKQTQSIEEPRLRCEGDSVAYPYNPKTGNTLSHNVNARLEVE